MILKFQNMKKDQNVSLLLMKFQVNKLIFVLWALLWEKLWKKIEVNGLNKLDSSKIIVKNNYQLKNLIWILLILKKVKLLWKKKKLMKMLLLLHQVDLNHKIVM